MDQILLDHLHSSHLLLLRDDTKIACPNGFFVLLCELFQDIEETLTDLVYDEGNEIATLFRITRISYRPHQLKIEHEGCASHALNMVKEQILTTENRSTELCVECGKEPNENKQECLNCFESEASKKELLKAEGE